MTKEQEEKTLDLLIKSYNLINEWNQNTREYDVLKMLEFSSRMVAHLYEIEDVVKEIKDINLNNEESN